jgi:Flp pilus assembly protein TadG
MALVLGACLIFLFAIFEYGRFVMLRQLMDNAAREGARQAVANATTLTTADVQNTVTNYLAGQPINVTSSNVYKCDPVSGANLGPWTSAAFGESIAVDVQGTYNPIFPTFLIPIGSQSQSISFFQTDTLTLSAKVMMGSEAN